MAGVAVSVSTGVMKPLLGKLATLMGDEYKKLKGLRKEVSFLKRELSDMNALLEKMDDAADELDPQARNWRKDIIEMSYDIEDYIDNFMNRVSEAGDNVGVLRKASHYLRTFKDRHRLANQFQEIKTLVIEASERRKRYMLDQCIPGTTRVVVDPRLSALYQKSDSLVGIDSQKEEIVRWVMDEEKQLKVMSIVGLGGLGKTTLANEVYREVGDKFDCKAIVSISQSPDIIKLLNSLMLQLGLRPYSHACELQDPINNIIKHLKDKRYFIIVDDLWDTRAWNTICCAFTQNDHYSRVMITTRIENVARVSCGNHGFIHYMKPLSEQDSRKLFFDRICESEDVCPPDVIELSCKILKKCGGLPLAIITMASMIACQPTTSKAQWAEYILNSLGAGFATKTPSYEDMMHIIDFSYKNLPHHLKACFLYLGIYPEDHMINQVELIRRWVAEGFVSCSGGQEVWNVAENYFSELVNRSMIQPAYGYYDTSCIEVTYCRVHDMLLELILRKCREDNFISLINGPEIMSEGQDRVVRRLTIDIRSGAEGGITLMGNTRYLSQVRSLNLFGGNCRVPNLAEFKFLRLLFFDVGNIKTGVDLSGINHLPQLRYLKVIIKTDGIKVLLPAQIRSLHALETLDLSEMYECCSIQEFVDLPRLSHLSVAGHQNVRLPDCIGKFKLLVTLSGFSLPMSSLESVESLGELTALTELIFGGDSSTDSGGMIPLVAALITSLEKLGNLRNITLWDEDGNDDVYCGDAMLEPSFSPPFHKIVTLNLGLLIFSRVPRWIGQLCCLRILVLRAKEIHQEDFNVIGTRLTSLDWLCLIISRIPTERIVTGGSTAGFNVLNSFWFDCDGVSCLTFEAGAMPNLKLLELVIDADGWDGATADGLQHLPSLKEIQIYNVVPATTATRTQEERIAKEALMMDMFRKASEALQTRPAVIFGGRLLRPKEMT